MVNGIPTRFGPRRSCTQAAIQRSKSTRYAAAVISPPISMAIFSSGSRNVDNVMVIVWAAVVLPPLKSRLVMGRGWQCNCQPNVCLPLFPLSHFSFLHSFQLGAVVDFLSLANRFDRKSIPVSGTGPTMAEK